MGDSPVESVRLLRVVGFCVSPVPACRRHDTFVAMATANRDGERCLTLGSV